MYMYEDSQCKSGTVIIFHFTDTEIQMCDQLKSYYEMFVQDQLQGEY